jgi:hypothetical protein
MLAGALHRVMNAPGLGYVRNEALYSSTAV